MKPEQVAELIEKLVEEKMRLATVLTSKTLGSNKDFFLQTSRKKLAEVRADLVKALGNSEEN